MIKKFGPQSTGKSYVFMSLIIELCLLAFHGSENAVRYPKSGRGDKRAVRQGHGDLHCNLWELLLGEVEGLADDGDSVLLWVPVCRQAGPEDGIVGHVQETDQGMPTFVVKPHLEGRDELCQALLHPDT